MKFSAILWILTIIASSEALKPNAWCSGRFLHNALGHCAAKYGATRADFYDYRYLKPARNHNVKCYRACQFIECRAYNGDGSFSANAPETTAFALTRRNPNLWGLVREVARYCVRALPAISFKHYYKRHNICDKTEEYLQCLRVNLPPETSFEGLF